MNKIKIRTSDIFGDKKCVDKHLEYCMKTAMRCKVIVVGTMSYEDDGIEVFLSGYKKDMIKYYFITLFECDYKWFGFKKLLSIIFTF